MIDPDRDAPYDRPNLSKDYLQGTAPEEWIPLRPSGFYEENGIERLSDAVSRIDRAERTVLLDSGVSVPYGALLLALGSTASAVHGRAVTRWLHHAAAVVRRPWPAAIVQA